MDNIAVYFVSGKIEYFDSVKSLMQHKGKLYEIRKGLKLWHKGFRFCVGQIIDCNAEIQNAMARAFFASAWADMVEESRNLSGCEIMDVMPETIDPAAIHAAETLARDICRANSARHVCELFDRLRVLSTDGADRPLTLELFGHYCAMQAMGHGVGLESFGRAACDALTVPYIEFGEHSLVHDYA